MTNLIHGESATEDAIHASKILFGGGLDGISENALSEVAKEIPYSSINPNSLLGEGKPLLEALVECGLSSSKGQAKKDIQGGGVNVNNCRIRDIQTKLTQADVHFGKYILLRRGKKNYAALTLE